MSKISLKHSGGNVVSLNSPTSAPTSADVAFKLPNADGTSGQAIVTDASGNLSFAGTGIILQVVQTMKTDTFSSTTSSSWTDITGVSVNITPSSASSKVLVSFHGACGSSDDSYSWLRIARVIGATTATDLAKGDSRGSAISCTLDGVQGVNDGFEGSTSRHSSFEFLDSPNTTSQITYKMQFYKAMGTNFIIGGTYQTQDANKGSVPTFMTVKEIAA